MGIANDLRDMAEREAKDYEISYKLRDQLRIFADRIDLTMVELPKDRDGVPIHVMDEVYTPGGKKSAVTKICITQNVTTVTCNPSDVTTCIFFPNDISHSRPDSLERIADDIELAEKWCDGDGEYGTGVSSVEESTLQEWADRIRKLAKEVDGR